MGFTLNNWNPESGHIFPMPIPDKPSDFTILYADSD